MQTEQKTIKQQLHELAEELPADATWRDVLYEAYYRQQVEAGMDEAQRGDFASSDEVREAFSRWGVDVEAEMDASGPSSG